MKKFLIIGTLNCVTYKDVFPSVKRCEAWFGDGKNLDFYLPDGTIKNINTRWYTNLGKNNRQPLQLTEHYSPEKYPKYDNYEAIEVGKVKHIPCDYYGEMGVPLTFLDKHCPEQFEVIGITTTWSPNKIKIYTSEEEKQANYPLNSGVNIIKNGQLKQVYKRILIKKRR